MGEKFVVIKTFDVNVFYVGMTMKLIIIPLVERSFKKEKTARSEAK